MDLPRFNWTGLNLNESVNKWAGDIGTGLADVMGMSDDDRKQAINWLSNVPIVGDYLRFSDRQNQIQDYMENRGLSWSDVKYPALLDGGQSYIGNAIRTGYSFVSRNIEKLYDDEAGKNIPRRPYRYV